MSDEKITYGKFVTKKTTRPATEVDCSSWADPSVTNWTYGKFVTKKSTRPKIVSRLTVPHLRLKVSFQPGVPLETLEATTKAMVETLHAAAPDLNLQYDPTRSGIEQDSQGAWVAVIGLMPQTPPANLNDRYIDLFGIARAAASAGVEVERLQEACN